MNAAELLSNALSPDQQIRDSATRQLEDAARDNIHGYLHTLAAELANENSPIHIRRAAGLAFKNALASRDTVNQSPLSQRWLALPDSATNPLKHSILSTLGSPQHAAGGVAAQCVSAIAAIEVPVQRWPELIPNLLQFVGDQDNVGLRVNTLQAVGYVCEVISPEFLSARSNEILTAVVQGARKEEPSPEVQSAAIHALYNSLEFIRDNFDREGERNYIMQVVCEATQSPALPVQVGAFECLVKIMDLYYEKMDFYMERALFGLTIMGMRHPEEPVALQAIEFWSTVCETEVALAEEAQEAASYDEVPEIESKHFAKPALPEILPVLLELLSQQSEDDDEDEWTRSMAAAACLELLARDVGDDIVQPVVPFVEAGITRPEWQHREAAVMAFGSILDGPEPTTLAPLVTQALGTLIQMMQNDQSLQVRDTVAWTLSKITEIMLENIDPSMHLQNLVTALVLGLNASPRIINSCCSSLSNLVSQMSMPPDLLGDDVPTSPMSQYYPGILKALMSVSEKPANENNSRTAAYQTLATFASSAPNDTLQLVQEILVAMLARQEALLSMHNQLVGSDDRSNWNDMQINICVVLQSIIAKSPAMVAPLADRIMTNLISLFQTAGRHSGVLEDAFATVGAMASTLEAGFTKYLEAISPFLFNALASYEDWQAGQAGVYLTSDVARAVNDALTPYAERIMVGLVDILRSPVIQRQVKPSAISAIGEVALAIGGAFTPFVPTTMEILSQAGQTAATVDDPAMLEFVWQMREAIVDAFIGILNGLKVADASPFRSYVPGIMGFLKACWQDDERTDTFSSSSLGLIGDFADTYKAGVRDEIMQEWVQNAIAYGRQRGSSKAARKNAIYAAKVCLDALP
ncbi:importin beta-1 subunit (Karyopherin beta-1 subunit) [Naematelia encephala]|uniref:Importin-95 n=1 Tax=Naematelia encephala TaxID=71784 RepID=A0A1Y2AZ06_9TREE|nr:importin beta-1 subunit (Karyopherin beta-1 subunit) [Naematelia encephala]